MKAIVHVSYRDMKGNKYQVNEIVSDRVTLEYNLNGRMILVDFNISEVQIIIPYIKMHRNQANRDGEFISYEHKIGYTYSYEMPNGRVFHNVLKNPLKPNEYTTRKK
jgi:hypothetical protein